MLDKYKRIKAVQGLIYSLDEQINRLDTVKKEMATERAYDMLIDKYHEAIVELLKGEDTDAKKS